MATDEEFMELAIDAGERNAKYPFGAVLVSAKFERVIATGTNDSSNNPILHGEIAAMRSVQQNGFDHWPNLTLYSTAEPCPMCIGAILWAGIPRIVYGTSIATLVERGWPQLEIPAAEVVARSHRPQTELCGGVLEDACDRLFATARQLQD